MQLDVTWLYDDFEGNTGSSSTSSPSSTSSSPEGGGEDQSAMRRGGEKSDVQSMSWETLGSLRGPK